MKENFIAMWKVSTTERMIGFFKITLGIFFCLFITERVDAIGLTSLSQMKERAPFHKCHSSVFRNYRYSLQKMNMDDSFSHIQPQSGLSSQNVLPYLENELGSFDKAAVEQLISKYSDQDRNQYILYFVGKQELYLTQIYHLIQVDTRKCRIINDILEIYSGS